MRFFLSIVFVLLSPIYLFAFSDIVSTVHNLSASGPGVVKAFTETRICIFCHTPHNSTPETPLWNRELNPVNYTLYESSTLSVIPWQPSGPSRLCLSCHDGTVALGSVLSSQTEIELTQRYVSSSLDTDISDDHPVSFSYNDALPDPELAPSPPSTLLFYHNGNVHCSTCHDAHDNTHGKFLRLDNLYSKLCITCHANKTGWSTASHNKSTNLWNGLPPDPWFHSDGVTVSENGCENCHKPHSAGGPKRLLNYLEEELNCYTCHNGNVATTDIEAQFQKFSRHRIEETTIDVTPSAHDPAESLNLLSGHVECVDCHNPHASNDTTANPPHVSGSLRLTSGVSKDGVGVQTAKYEYEICYKCHGDSSQSLTFIKRVVDQNNVRLEFDPTNPSYHPVVAIGPNPDVPSIPSIFEPAMTTSDMIYCTDCHDSDESRNNLGGSGPKGPHGSIYPPLLRLKYEVLDFTPENFDNYRLCYQCHDRDKLLDDVNTRFSTRSGGHFGHLGPNVSAPCSACHDPHGIKDDGVSGSHTHLINFDITIATAVTGQFVPFFTDLGDRAGSCTLVCHGKTHIPDFAGPDPNTVNSTYP